MLEPKASNKCTAQTTTCTIYSYQYPNKPSNIASPNHRTIDRQKHVFYHLTRSALQYLVALFRVVMLQIGNAGEWFVTPRFVLVTRHGNEGAETVTDQPADDIRLVRSRRHLSWLCTASKCEENRDYKGCVNNHFSYKISYNMLTALNCFVCKNK